MDLGQWVRHSQVLEYQACCWVAAPWQPILYKGRKPSSYRSAGSAWCRLKLILKSTFSGAKLQALESEPHPQAM